MASTSRTAATTDCARLASRSAAGSCTSAATGVAAVLDERDDALLALLRNGQPHRLAGLVDPLLVHPVGDLEAGIAHGPGQRVPQGPWLLPVGEIDDETGRRRAHRAARDEDRRRARSP